MLFLFIYQYYTYTGAPHDWVLQEEQELYIIPEHIDSPRFVMGSCYSFCLIAHLHVFSSVL